MNRILIWDSTGDSPKWLEKYLEKNDVEVIHTIKPADPVPEILLQKDSWDWLLIFEKNMRSVFNTTIQALKLPLEKIIYALDGRSWLQIPKAIYTLLNDAGGGYLAASLILIFVVRKIILSLAPLKIALILLRLKML